MIKLNLTKRLSGAEGDFDLVVDTTITPGSFVALSGKSGSGKTTLLRMLAGLDSPDSGEIIVGDEVWVDSDRGINLKPQKRAIGFVFQDYSLFPNMSVRENIRFAAEDKNRVDELLGIIELTELAERFPASLSGGQQQRVALARAVARNPKILLLDEPLSALDKTTRAKLQDEILQIHISFGITTVLVSHDTSEIFKLANRMIELESGRVTRDGTPSELFSSSLGSRKFSFVGEVLEIKKADIVHIVSLAIGSSISEVVISKEEAVRLRVGDRVMIASKAFNPVLKKIV